MLHLILAADSQCQDVSVSMPQQRIHVIHLSCHPEAKSRMSSVVVVVVWR